jgi:heavy-metal-associated domain
MNVEFNEGADVKETMDKVVKACKKVESDCEIYL